MFSSLIDAEGGVRRVPALAHLVFSALVGVGCGGQSTREAPGGGATSAGTTSGGTTSGGTTGGGTTSGGTTSGGTTNAGMGGAGAGGTSSGGAAGGGGTSSTGGRPQYPACYPVNDPLQYCASSADCPDYEGCKIDGDWVPADCGLGCMPRRSCEVDDDCPDDGICVEFEEPCCRSEGRSNSTCGTRCNPMIDRCAAPRFCADDGHCRFPPCEPGGCGTNENCNPTTLLCERRKCTTNEDCQCGFCGDGLCRDAPGYCDRTGG